VKRFALPAVVLLGIFVRVPFWQEAMRTPLDGDTAIIGLMARHPLSSTTMWGQPYGSPLDAWLAAPALALLGHTMPVLRLVYFILGLCLIPLAAGLAGALDRRAALPAALLLACPPPYFLLLAAMPPPFYSSILLLCGLLLLMAIRTGDLLVAGALPRGTLVFWGLLAGLALWTHLMSATIVVAAALYLWRCAPRGLALWPAAAGAVAASAPLWWRAIVEAHALRVVSVSGRQEGMLEHLRLLVPQMHRPLTGLIGTHVPWVADDPYSLVFAPGLLAIALVLIYASLVFGAARLSRLRGAAGLLLLSALLTVVAFPFPLRANPSAVRFLTPAYLPIAAAIAWSIVVRSGVRRAVLVSLVLACLHLTVGARLLQAWRSADRAEAPFYLPDLGPLARELDGLGIHRAYAPYATAYRLSFETNERIIASQPWNERFLHYPLPYLDEVRFSRTVAWTFLPETQTETSAVYVFPTLRTFEDQLGAIGGHWKRSTIGHIVLFHGFAPPFGPAVVPLPSAAARGSGDRSVTWPVSPPRALDAVTLVAPSLGPRLPRGFDLEVSADGTTFERVVRRRRREERRDLRWVNGGPQYVIDDDLVAAALSGQTVAAVRLTPVEAEEWAVADVLLHESHADGSGNAWDEWLDPNLDWRQRAQALAAHPRPEREDWYYRRLLAARH
jgi:hypothetical protein